MSYFPASSTLSRILISLHLVGASVWIGGRLVLATTLLPRALRHRDPSIILDFENGFERIGLPSLLLQVFTGLLLASRWLPEFGFECVDLRCHQIVAFDGYPRLGAQRKIS